MTQVMRRAEEKALDPPAASRTTTLLVATAAMIVSLAVYTLPAALAPSVTWATTPYATLHGPTNHHRLPGYSWPIVTLSLYALAVLPSLIPRRLASRPLPAALGKAAAFLLILISLFLLQWLLLTPMFS